MPVQEGRLEVDQIGEGPGHDVQAVGGHLPPGLRLGLHHGAQHVGRGDFLEERRPVPLECGGDSGIEPAH